MVASNSGDRLREMAREVFEVFTRIGLAAPARRRRAGDLKEIEFLTLTMLEGRGTMIVGDIQRRLGVLPAQMSRIIRSLEDRERPMIACHINPHDKRKVDVQMTAAGEEALQEYQALRVSRITDLLRELPPDLQDDLGRVLERLRERMASTARNHRN